MLFKAMKKKRCEESNIVVMSELKRVGLVLKVKPIKNILFEAVKNSYMISPYVFKPWQYSNTRNVWKTLGGKEL